MSGSISKNGSIRCVVCGRFMSFAEVDNGGYHFTPDSEFTEERSEFWHEQCVERVA